MCLNNCVWSPNPACETNCEDDYTDCAVCDGHWTTCVKTEPCCGIQCADGYTCEDASGECLCINDEELCGADNTGDGLDNDCDGDIDEGCADCAPEGASQICDSDGCSGTQDCSSGQWTACEKNNPCCGVDCGDIMVCEGSSGICVCKNDAERCKANGVGDGIDNDCDGDVDEDCMTQEEYDVLQNQSDSPLPPVDDPVQPEPPASGNESDEPLVGGDRDAHECIPSAGYTWCESKQECIKPWETNCPAAGSQIDKPPGTTPPATTPPAAKGSEIDMNMIIILLIVIVVIVGLLVAIKMMKGKKGAAPAPVAPPAPPAPPAPQPVVIQQPPQA